MRCHQVRNRRAFFYSWDDVPVIIDVAMAARILGFSPEYTRRMLRQGKIPANKIGSDWRISKEKFRAYVEGTTKE